MGSSAITLTTHYPLPFPSLDPFEGYQFFMQRLSVIAPSGIQFRDNTQTQYTFTLQLTVQDDASSSATHDSLISAMVAPGQQDFIFNSNPSFAVSESAAVKA